MYYTVVNAIGCRIVFRIVDEVFTIAGNEVIVEF